MRQQNNRLDATLPRFLPRVLFWLQLTFTILNTGAILTDALMLKEHKKYPDYFALIIMLGVFNIINTALLGIVLAPAIMEDDAGKLINVSSYEYKIKLYSLTIFAAIFSGASYGLPAVADDDIHVKYLGSTLGFLTLFNALLSLITQFITKMYVHEKPQTNESASLLNVKNANPSFPIFARFKKTPPTSLSIQTHGTFELSSINSNP